MIEVAFFLVPTKLAGSLEAFFSSPFILCDWFGMFRCLRNLNVFWLKKFVDLIALQLVVMMISILNKFFILYL